MYQIFQKVPLSTFKALLYCFSYKVKIVIIGTFLNMPRTNQNTQVKKYIFGNLTDANQSITLINILAKYGAFYSNKKIRVHTLSLVVWLLQVQVSCGVAPPNFAEYLYCPGPLISSCLPRPKTVRKVGPPPSPSHLLGKVWWEKLSGAVRLD